jgi:CBS domain-containing protein
MTMNVAQLMKRTIVSLPSSANLDTAAACMEEAGIRHLPIVDGSGLLVGVVSQRDVARARDVIRTAEGRRQQLRLGDIMRTEALKVTPELPAHEAAAMMIEHKIGMLPVVEPDGRVVGIVTETDFLEVAREALLGVEPARRARA